MIYRLKISCGVSIFPGRSQKFWEIPFADMPFVYYVRCLLQISFIMKVS